MSARSSSRGQLVEARRRAPPKRSASAIARGRAAVGDEDRSRRPASASARAVSSLVSPAPMISTWRAARSPSDVARERRPRPTAMLARPAPIAVSRAHALAGRQRGAEQPVASAGPVVRAAQRRLVGALDLALDLGLADDHRVEPAGDAVQVARGVAVARRVDRRRPARSAAMPRAGARAARARWSRPRPGRRRRDRARCGCRSRCATASWTSGSADELAQEALGLRLGERERARAARPARSCARCPSASSSLIARLGSRSARSRACAGRRARAARRARARCGAASSP